MIKIKKSFNILSINQITTLLISNTPKTFIFKKIQSPIKNLKTNTTQFNNFQANLQANHITNYKNNNPNNTTIVHKFFLSPQTYESGILKKIYKRKAPKNLK